MFNRLLQADRRDFDSLSEREVLALAVTAEEEDGRIYAELAANSHFDGLLFHDDAFLREDELRETLRDRRTFGFLLLAVLFYPAILGVTLHQLIDKSTRTEREGIHLTVIGAAKAALTNYLMPVFTAVLGWLLLGEGLQPYHWLGATLIFTGLLLGTQGAVKGR